VGLPYGSFADQLITQFRRFELRGRGWLVFPHPVELEPPFRPFLSHTVIRAPVPDDARHSFQPLPSLSAGLVEALDPPEHPIQEARDTGGITEFTVLLPKDFNLRVEAAEQLLASFRFCLHPVSFELVATLDGVWLILACAEGDAEHLSARLAAFAPDAALVLDDVTLAECWYDSPHDGLVVDLGLSKEFMRPLPSLRLHALDPLAAAITALGRLEEDEVGILQVLFTAAKAPWPQSILTSVHGNDGEPLTLLGEGLAEAAKRKVSKPLFAVRPRIAVKAAGHPRRIQLLRSVLGAFAPHSVTGTNELIALDGADWSADAQEEDLIQRTAHRTGMLLNAEELATLVHLPGEKVLAPRFVRKQRRSHPAPAFMRADGALLGTNRHDGVETEISVPLSLRLRHTYIIGGTGTGKSTLLLNLILQDIEAGHGVAVLDPHGDLVDAVCMRLPESRIGDVLLVDPTDEQYPIPLNILSASSDLERTLLASDLVAVFRRLSTSWGDQMNAVLANAILAFLESDVGGALPELRRFLVEKEYRAEFLRSVRDPEIVYYWQREFPLLSGKPQAPILTRLDAFLRPKLIRRMVSQTRGSVDFRKVMDSRGILLCKLSQGAIGAENSYLLGALIVSKLQQAALSRQDTASSDRVPFFVFLDEFQHFVTPSVADLLTGVRKYALGLTLAHQQLSQLSGKSDELADAALSAATRIVFRASDSDAKALSSGFSHFEAADLLNLSTGEAVVRVERAEYDFNLKTLAAAEVDPASGRETLRNIIDASRAQHAVELSENEPARDAAETPPADTRPPVAEPKAHPRAPEPAAPPPPVKLPPSLPGAGGQEHRYLQNLVKGFGHAENLRVSIEVPILDGVGRVDVVLEREGFRAAVQVTVTTPTEHEVANLQKCLAAGFDVVVLTSPDGKKLKRAEAAVRKVLAASELSRLLFTAPEDLPQLIRSWAEDKPSGEVVSGYKVNVRINEPSSDDASMRERIRDLLTRSLKRKR
jgi:hypothetical protein